MQFFVGQKEKQSGNTIFTSFFTSNFDLSHITIVAATVDFLCCTAFHSGGFQLLRGFVNLFGLLFQFASCTADFVAVVLFHFSFECLHVWLFF